ncbi:hypothetical protein [Halorussus caseinilyticus]|uniref:Uncharacterized protein n=2 Tax=Halorussus caseinilyticus TaxID=3034025 RepID=A0ABD5WME0_9EURY
MKQGGEASAQTLPYSDDISLEEAYDKLDKTVQEVYQDSDMKYPGGRYTYDLDTAAREARLGADKNWALPKPFVKGVHTRMINRFGPTDANPHLEESEPEGDEKFVWEVTW